MPRPTPRPSATRTKRDGSLRATYVLASLALLVLVCLSSTIALQTSNAAGVQASGRMLSLEERVAHQRAVDEVYWKHTIWPATGDQQKPGLDEVLPLETTREKVEDTLRKSDALTRLWKRPITAEQLQAEMTRMARETKQPEVLRELWRALGDDPFVIAETLARPSLVDRQARSLYATDERFHGDLRERAGAQLRGHKTLDALRRAGGRFSEVEFVKVKEKAPRVFDEQGGGSAASTKSGALELDAAEWDAEQARLTEMFSKTSCIECGDVAERLPTGTVSSLQESADSFYVTSVVVSTKQSLKVARVEWPKVGFDSWWSGESVNYTPEATAESFSYRLAEMRASAADDTWTPTRWLPVATGTAVWTGTEVIIWGGTPSNGGRTNTGSRYNPATDTWTATSTVGAPDERSAHTAVWTGTEMIVWGGSNGSSRVNTGGRYNPVTDTWKATANGNVFRSGHTAVWTGKQMIIWGGCITTGNDGCRIGGVYDPTSDIWKPASLVNAPSQRTGHRAVWTGTEMLIWGGANTGGLYNPDTDTWRPTNTFNAPSARAAFTMVWTGTEAIVWSGYEGNFVTLNTGGRYNPSTDTWTPTATANAPDPRYYHTAAWSGSEMIVYGGRLAPAAGQADQHLNTGGRYNPSTNTWRPTSTINAPTKLNHVAVWAGSEMIVWGGSATSLVFRSGARYNPANDSWTPTNNEDSVPAAELGVWSGTEMIVWGRVPLCSSACASVGGRYNPATNLWRPMSVAGAPLGDYADGAAAVWTGREMILWGAATAAGARYDPLTDMWTRASTTNAPAGKRLATAVWTGTEMLVWGGDSNPDNTPAAGGRYNPSNDTWQLMTMDNAPAARNMHSAVWTGAEMVVWGGSQYFAGSQINTGGRYNPATDTWRPTSTEGAPEERFYHTTVWTGTEMVVWGGWYYSNDGSRFLNTGGRYNPASDSWQPTSLSGAPQARSHHRAVWTGSIMIVWGGLVPVTWTSTGDPTYTGARYSPATDLWTPTSLQSAASRRHSHVQVWTGTEMLVWGGKNGLGDGAVYTAPGASAGNTPPSVRVLSPAENAHFEAGSTIEISTEASDGDGTVSSVSFYANETLLATDTEAPYSFTWNRVRSGNYAITAVANDNSGGVTRSTPVNIIVEALISPPNVVITSPAEMSSFEAPATIRVMADVQPNPDYDITKVEFWLGDGKGGTPTLVYTDTTAPYGFDLSNQPAGTYGIYAFAHDGQDVGISPTTKYTVTGATRPFNISGQVVDNRGVPIVGISVKLTGTDTATATTSVDGYYFFGSLLQGGNYTVMPSAANYSYAPPSLTFNNLGSTQSNANFLATQAGYGISGRLVDAGGSPIYPATINLSGSKTATTGTNINGYYFFSNLAAGGTYTVQPYKNAYRFEPDYRTFTNLSAEQAADFTGRYVPASVNFSASVESASEGGGAATLTVSRAVNPDAAVTVNYSTADGTAIAGSDYAATSGTLSFAAGELSKTVMVPILDDAAVENTETFTVMLSGPADALVASPSVASVTITENDSCSYQLSQTARNFLAAGETVTVNVTAPVGCSWTATSHSGFISLSSGTANSGDGTVTFSVAANTASTQRTGTLTIAGHNFTVTQAGVTCAFTISPASQSVDAIGGTGSVNLTSAATDCAWNAASDASWITISSGASGIGSSVVNFAVAANPSSLPRTGTLTIAGQTLTITQGGVACFYTVSQQTPDEFTSAGGQGSFQMVAPQGCAWSVSSLVPWITITSGSRGTGTASVTFTVAANPGAVRTGQVLHTDDSFINVRQAAAPASLSLESSVLSVSEDAQRAELKVMRAGDTNAAASVTLRTVDDPESVPCATLNGKAYARCDYATTIETLYWAAGDGEPKIVGVPIINDGRSEGAETLRVRLSDPRGGIIGDFETATLTITDNEAEDGANPIFETPFFVRQQYLDFLSREPEAGEPWSRVLDNCFDVNNNPACDRILVSQSFFGSPEFRLKGFFVYNFYSVALNRRPTYEEIIPDMRSVSGATQQEVYQKRAAFPSDFTNRIEFKALYDSLSDAGFVNTLMNRYGLQQIIAPDPANPESITKVTLSRADLINRLGASGAQSLTRAQVLRAIVESNEVGIAEYNPAFVAMQYYGYLRRTPEEDGYQAWLRVINQDPNNIRIMVNGFMNSSEYKLRFGRP